MKKLTNVSPFLLLLFPVFIAMLFSFTANFDQTAEKEVTAKTSSTPVTVVVKATALLVTQ